MAIAFEKYKLNQRWWSADYEEMLIGLVPRGLLWVFDRYSLPSIIQDVLFAPGWQDKIVASTTIQDFLGGVATGNLFRRLLASFAGELSRLETDAWCLLNETDPGVAECLLSNWERVLGLPEKCSASLTLTIAERQQAAHAKLFKIFQTVTAQFLIDYALTLGWVITIVENSSSYAATRCGVARCGVNRCGGVGGSGVLVITVVSGPVDQTLLKCALEKLKPAHVIIKWL
jgi:uncharacterized protein YmfQ (DUF2313 family)